MYRLDRSGRRRVTGLDRAITINISKKRKHDALIRAYKSMVQPENEEASASIRTKENEKKNKSPKKEGEKNEQTVQLKLFGEEFDEGNTHIKSKKLLSKFVDEISLSDIGTGYDLLKVLLKILS